MTKKIRIENADLSDHKVRVFIERKGPDGQWVRKEGEAPTALDLPCALHEGWVWQEQRLVVEEV